MTTTPVCYLSFEARPRRANRRRGLRRSQRRRLIHRERSQIVVETALQRRLGGLATPVLERRAELKDSLEFSEYIFLNMRQQTLP
jgi:hypothetical protein